MAITKAEKAVDVQQMEVARTEAKKAIELCQKEGLKTARPQMVMTVVANAEQDFPSVISWAEQGLKQEPGLPLAYMNMCGAYTQMKKFDQAIKACETGLKTRNEWSAMLNSNMGLAIFTKAGEEEKPNDSLKAEKYFKESQKLDPKIAQNYFFLGIIEHVVKNNVTAATPLYKKGCDLQHAGSCEKMKELQTQSAVANAIEATAPTGVTPPAAAKEPVRKTAGGGAGEDQLWGELRQNYLKKGLPGERADAMIEEFKTNFRQLPAEHRQRTIQGLVDASKN